MILCSCSDLGGGASIRDQISIVLKRLRSDNAGEWS